MKIDKISKTILPFTILLSLLCLTSGCTVTKTALWKMKYSAWRVFTEEGRFVRLTDRAYAASENEEYEKAIKLYSRAMKKAPDKPDAAYDLAVAYALLGQDQQFWNALEETENRGFDQAWQLEEEPAFKPYRDEDRFNSLLEKIIKNKVENCHARRRSNNLPPLSSVPSFDSLEELNRFFAEEESEMDKENWKLSHTNKAIQQRFHIARKIAAIRLYIRDHSNAADFQEAQMAEIDAWIKLTRHGWTYWTKDIAKNLKASIHHFLEVYPETSRRKELEFISIEAVLRGVIEADDCSGWESYPLLNCEDTISLLDNFLSDYEGRSDHWITRALGMKALCLSKIYPDDLDQAREVYETYLQQPEIPYEEKTMNDYPLRYDLRSLKFKLEGAPDFTAETLEGDKASLSDFQDKVLLLDFWGPG
jgi:hypothetical protein